MKIEGYKAFALNAYLLRRKRFESQDYVATNVGLSRLGYQKFENIVTVPKPESQERIANFFGTSIGDLFATIEFPDALSSEPPSESNWEYIKAVIEVYRKAKAIRDLSRKIGRTPCPTITPTGTLDEKSVGTIRNFLGYDSNSAISRLPERLWDHGILTVHYHITKPTSPFIVLNGPETGPFIIFTRGFKSNEERLFTYVQAIMALFSGAVFAEAAQESAAREFLLPNAAFHVWSSERMFLTSLDRFLCLKIEYGLDSMTALSVLFPKIKSSEEMENLRKEVIRKYAERTLTTMKEDSEPEALSWWRHPETGVYALLSEAMSMGLIDEEEKDDLSSLGRSRTKVTVQRKENALKERVKKVTKQSGAMPNENPTTVNIVPAKELLSYWKSKYPEGEIDYPLY